MEDEQDVCKDKASALSSLMSSVDLVCPLKLLEFSSLAEVQVMEGMECADNLDGLNIFRIFVFTGLFLFASSDDAGIL